MPRFDFDPPAQDPVGVLTSTAPVLRGARHVGLDAAALARAVPALGAAPPAAAEDSLHCAFLPPRRLLNYLLLLEALNFCFWDDEPRWRVAYRGGRHDGYWALAAALHRAVREDAVPVWDAHWMADATRARMAALLRGEGREIPMLDQRTEAVREAGRVLLARWRGQFAHAVEEARGNAPALVHSIAAEFPSFRDEARWTDPASGALLTVRFLKRAQIFASDLARLLPDHPLGQLDGLEHLSAFADYKVPQVLRRLGILVLAPPLAARVDRKEELPAGSAEEVEIRAATVWGCEWIVRALDAARRDGVRRTAATVDYRLWLAGQEKAGLPPYHRTRTIYY